MAFHPATVILYYFLLGISTSFRDIKGTFFTTIWMVSRSLSSKRTIFPRFIELMISS